ncbi:MAG: type I secretion C-terminal target domain-containing protein, partial [Methylotenera sp.]
NANFSGTDSFSYTVTSPAGVTETATVNVTVNAVNDAPIGVADNYTADEGTATVKTTVLVNDTDPEGSALTVAQFATNNAGLNASTANGTNTITTALGGTVVMNVDGTFTYTAPARNHGDVTSDVDSFAYKPNDGSLSSAAWTTVTINITDTNPIANNDVDSVGINSTVAGNVITGAGGVTADTLNVDGPHSLTNVVLTAGTQVSNTLGAGNVRTIVTTRGTLAIDQDDGSYTYTASVAPIVVTNPTGIASFTGVGINLYGFDTAEPYNTAGNVNSGLNLGNLNATSAARARFQDNAGETDDGFGAEQNAGDTNTNRTENGEQLAISLGVASKSTSIALSNLLTGEVATWETYNAAGAIVSSGTTAGVASGLTNINISSGTAFNYVVVRSTGAASAYRVDGITVIPEPTGVTDVFTYTLADSDGNTSNATLTMNYDTTTTATNDVATVYESGINENGVQNGGTQEAQTIEIATGNVLANDTGVSSFSTFTISGGTIVGGTVNASAPDVNGVVTVTVTDTTSGSRPIATITVYTQNFGANVKGDYVVDLVGRTTDGAGTNDSFTVNYTLTNSVSGEVDNASLTVDVVDDVPTVQDAIVQVQTGTLPDTNLVFVIDSSGSMAGEVKSVATDGTVTIMDRLQATQLAVAAVINEYFSQGGNISVTLIDFDTTAANRGTYTTATSAIAALNLAANFTVGGGTNYEAALTTTQAAIGIPVVGEKYTVYFISDGVPTQGDTTDPAANGYRAFATANNIDTYAIGIASDISNPTELNNIHNVDSDGSGVKDAAIIVTNVATLDDVLLASVPTSFGGSVAGSTASSSLNFGADGGYISSLVMHLDTNGDNVPDAYVTFNYNPTTGQITVVGGGTPQTGFPLTSNMLTLNNANGFEDGILIFNFTTGEYTYQTAGFATEGEQFDINFVATDGDGDTATGKQTIQIVDGKPVANNDVDTLMGNASFFEGNVISAIGTDGGDSLQLTSFSTGRSGEDNPGDNGSVSSIAFRGVTFDLTAVVGSTVALGGTYTVTIIGGVNTLTWTHATNGSSLVFNEDGYYRYAPPTAELSTNVTGTSTNYALTSAALVTTASTAGMTLTGIARTSAAEGSAAINTPNADGVGIVGNTNTRIDSLESLVITFNTSTHPHGVQGVTITVDTSNSNLGGTNAFNYNVYNVHGELIGQFASNLEGNVVLPAGLTGIGKIVIDAGGVGSYPGAYGSISAVRYSTILDTAGTPAPAAEVISYTITDTDGDTSSATLTLNNIIDDIAGTAANNTINGTARNENISGGAGDDTINAGAGFDMVRGGDGNDIVDGGADDDQLYGNAGNDTISGGIGKDQIYGDAGNDTLDGNDGDDFISGGDGSDVINGGIGADIILGGAGNDTLTGGTGVDVFRWELADKGTTSSPATDVITDFDPAAVGGDVLDIRDMLTGEQHVSGTGNLTSYLHFEVVGANTIVHISNNGGFSNGFSPTKDVQRITLTGVDLVTGFADDQAIIQNLLTNNKLITD